MSYSPNLSFDAPTSGSKRLWSPELFDSTTGLYPGDPGYPAMGFTVPTVSTYPLSGGKVQYYESSASSVGLLTLLAVAKHIGGKPAIDQVDVPLYGTLTGPSGYSAPISLTPTNSGIGGVASDDSQDFSSLTPGTYTATFSPTSGDAGWDPGTGTYHWTVTSPQVFAVPSGLSTQTVY